MSSRRPTVPTRTTLAAALTAAGICGRVSARDLVEQPRRGLAHLHWRVRETGLLIRLPIGRSDAAALERQAETFRRMAPSEHAPRLEAVLPPSRELPGGLLLVEAVSGRSPVVPRDFAAIADAIAAIHNLPLPPPAARPPLASPADPFQATLATIERHVAAAWPQLSEPIRDQFAAELVWARDYAAAHAAELRTGPRTLVITDAHPRNFIIRPDGRAICVDLEKALYGAPGIDLAHATLPAAIAWGRRGEHVTEGDRNRFFARYFARRGVAVEHALRPLREPLRRLTWLRTTAAFAAFRASGAERVLGPAARTLARRAIAEALDASAMRADRR